MRASRPPKTSSILQLRLPDGAAASLAAETTSATVLFVDLRGYTSFAEQLPAAAVMRLLDEFCVAISGLIESHAGQIFHVAGDGMMAGFGVRGALPQGARAALSAGLDMVRHFEPIAARWQQQLAIDSGIGVGIHSGEVALGSLGPSGRQAPTLVGDTVNVAARLCNRARAGEVLFSAAVAAALDSEGAAAEPRPFLQLPQFELRGRSRPLDIWCVPALARLAL